MKFWLSLFAGICCGITVSMASWAASVAEKPTLQMGVFAFQDKAILQDHYTALAQALNQRMPDHQLKIHVLSNEEIIEAIDRHQLDILFTNPAIYQRLRRAHALISPIATARMRYDQHTMTSLGGAIFQRSDQPPITQLSQLIGKRIAVPSMSSAGSYMLPLYELHKQGIDRDELDWLTVNSNDEVIKQVMNGGADVGFVRTGILEEWISSQYLKAQDIYLINSANLPAYPFMLSTELVPEWPVYALSHVSESAIKSLTIALFSLTREWPGAQALSIDSFTPPADYYVLEKMLTSLKLPPFDSLPELSWSELWQAYQWQLLLALSLFGLVVSLLIWVLYLYRHLATKSQQLKQASLIFDASIEGIVITDAQRRIIDVNKAFETISGYRKKDVLGLDPRFLKSGKQSDSFYAEMWSQLNSKGFWRGELLNRRKNGALYPELLTIYAISDDKKVVHNYVAIFSDISQQKAQQAKLERLLHYDVLTGLPNRSLLNDRVKQALINAREQQHYVAIVFIDLDGFKAVNDTYGHNAGDSLLTELGNRFLTVMRSQCTIARIGGDEFIAVMTNLTSRESAYPILDQLLAVCNQPFLINGEAVHISASIGVDFYTPSDYDQEISEVNLIQQADKAMYIAKQQGKNQIWFFDQNHHGIDQSVNLNVA
jgi:diguanylate cyclase (GGDEF)-like protein/PAS domain S-box-containing protein